MFESNFTTSKGPCQLIHIATGMLSMLSMLSVTRDVWHVCFCQGWDHETEPWRKCHRSQRFQRVGRSRLPFGVQQDACLRGCVDGLKGGKGGVFFVRFAGARHGIWNVYSQIPQRCKRKVVRVLGVAFFVHRLACLQCLNPCYDLDGGIILLGHPWPSAVRALVVASDCLTPFPISVNCRLWCGSFPNCHTCDADCDRRRIWEASWFASNSLRWIMFNWIMLYAYRKGW